MDRPTPKMMKFTVLYSKHKTQKKKLFQNGFLKYYPASRKAVLFDESSPTVIDSLFVKEQPSLGDRLESEMFLIDLDELLVEPDPSNPTAALESLPTDPIPMAEPPSLKRRKLGGSGWANKPFQVPRKVPRSDPPPAPAKISRPAHTTAIEKQSLIVDTHPVTVSIAPSPHIYVPKQPATLPSPSNNELDAPDDFQLSILRSLGAEAESTPDAFVRLDDEMSPQSPGENYKESVTTNALNMVADLPEDFFEFDSVTLDQAVPAFKPVAAPANRAPHTRRPISNFVVPSKLPTSHVTEDDGDEVLVAAVRRGLSSETPTHAPRGFVAPQIFGGVMKQTKWDHNSVRFPDPETCKAVLGNSAMPPNRQQDIPEWFRSLKDYQRHFALAIHEEMNLMLLNVANQYHNAYAQVVKDSNVGPRQQSALRSNGLKVYFNVELTNEANQTFKSQPPRKCLYLGVEAREHHSCYSKDDLWIISSNSNMIPRNADDIFFLARSVFHGPSTKDGMLEIEPVDPEQRIRLRQSQVINCIRGPNMGSELTMLDNLRKLSEDQLPILPVLLNPSTIPATIPSPKIEAVIPQVSPQLLQSVREDILKQYRLNDDQVSVLDHCASWFTSKPLSHVALVHGVFGSGKSFMLTVIIVFIATLLDKVGKSAKNVRILISAATNTAVDRILLGLIDLGFDSFMRVGSIKRIAKALFPYTYYKEKGEDKRADERAAKELEGMSASDPADQRYIDQLRRGTGEPEGDRMDERARKLKQARVVGVTCIASAFPALNDNVFPLVILDECSQMIEPLSLLPIGRFGCEKLILVGDPMQLPPQLSSFSDQSSMNFGLAKTLFTRFANCHHQPTLLRTQYRLHPLLSGIVNKLFYESKLKNGVTHPDRAPLCPDLPTLLLCDSNSHIQEKTDRSGSFLNVFEADVVVQLVRMLLHRGIAASQIGVICLYKAQEAKISSMLVPPPEALFVAKANTKAKRKRKPKKRRRKKDSLIDDEAEEDDEEDEEALGADDEGEAKAEPGSAETGEPEIHEHPEARIGSVQVSTVDAFQGAEKDIIIVTCCRTSKRGFIDSPNRLNVALTRAKRHLIIVGVLDVLQGSPLWKRVIDTARNVRGGIQSAEAVLYTKSFKPAEAPLQEALPLPTTSEEVESQFRQMKPLSSPSQYNNPEIDALLKLAAEDLENDIPSFDLI